MDDKKPKTKRPKVPKLKTDSEPKNEQVLIKKSSMITTLFDFASCYFEMIYLGS